MLFNLDFASNTILSCFFFFLVNIGLYFLYHAGIIQNFNPTAEFVIPLGIPTKEAKVETEKNPLTIEIKISNPWI